VRVFAQRIHEKRDLTGDPPKELAGLDGQLNAMALTHAILDHVADLYRQQRNPQLLQ
jgi:CHASE3 domain sensor protein